MQIIDMQEKQDLLLFRYDTEEQLAIPLSLVFKVEQIEVSQIQIVSDNHFINLEGKNAMLLYLDKYLKIKPFPKALAPSTSLPRRSAVSRSGSWPHR